MDKEIMQVAPVYMVQTQKKHNSLLNPIIKNYFFAEKETAREYISLLVEREKEIYIKAGHSLAEWKEKTHIHQEDDREYLVFTLVDDQLTFVAYYEEFYPSTAFEMREELRKLKAEVDAMKEEFWDMYT